MRQIPRPRSTVLALALLMGAPSLGAQPSLSGDKTLHVCSLLTKAEVEKYIAKGRQMFQPPDEGSGSCNYEGDMGQILVFTGVKAEDDVQQLLKSFKHDKDPRHPVSGLGSDAWVIYPKPRNEYEATVAAVHARVGQRVLMVSIAAKDGKTGESVRADVEAVTKLLIERLK